MAKTAIKLLIFIWVQSLVWSNVQASQFHFVQVKIWYISGDTGKGWIDEYGLREKPNRIRFKSDKNDPENIFYTAADVKAFQLNNALFESYVGYVDSAHLFLVPKDTVINPHRVKDTLFLKPLIVGTASLFMGNDKNGMVHFFYRKKGDSLMELHYYSIQWSEKGTNIGILQKASYYRIERDEYKQQMLAAFSDNKTIYEQLARAHLHYNKNAFVKWFQLYNNSHTG